MLINVLIKVLSIWRKKKRFIENNSISVLYDAYRKTRPQKIGKSNQEKVNNPLVELNKKK